MCGVWILSYEWRILYYNKWRILFYNKYRLHATLRCIKCLSLLQQFNKSQFENNQKRFYSLFKFMITFIMWWTEKRKYAWIKNACTLYGKMHEWKNECTAACLNWKEWKEGCFIHCKWIELIRLVWKNKCREGSLIEIWLKGRMLDKKK